MTSTKILIVVLACLAVPVLAIGGVAAYYVVSGTPLMDEWQCSDGEAPYVYPEGGRACAPEGSSLPAGATWDPFGNRPFECHDRWGWVEVIPVEDDGENPTDCVRKGDRIPTGWRAVED